MIFAVLGSPLAAREFSFPAQVEIAGQALERVGQSHFKWAWFSVYDGVLYLPAEVDPENVLADVPKRLELLYFRGFPADRIAEAGDKKLRDNIDDATFTRLSEQVAQMNALYVDLEEGDRYSLTYVPGQGTTLAHNGTDLGTVPGADFASAYFRIWLGDDPVGDRFRDELLGRR